MKIIMKHEMEKLMLRARKGVVKVILPSGKSGSAFFVSSNTLITAAHVVGSSNTVSIKLSNYSNVLKAKVIFLKPEYDIAFLEIDENLHDNGILEYRENGYDYYILLKWLCQL